MSTYSMTRQGGKNFLEIRLDAGECEDSIVVGMLENNEIKQSIPIQILHQGDDTVYRYNISGLMPLQFIYKENMTRKRFLGIIEGILESLLDAEEYMIEPCSVDWDYANIYVDEKHNRAKLIYLPLERENESFSIYRFFHELIFYARLDMSENSAYHSELIHFMNSSNEGNFSLSDFLLLVRKLNSESIQKTSDEKISTAGKLEAAPQQKAWEKERKEETAAEERVSSQDLNETAAQTVISKNHSGQGEKRKEQKKEGPSEAPANSGRFNFGIFNKITGLKGGKNSSERAFLENDFGFDIPEDEAAVTLEQHPGKTDQKKVKDTGRKAVKEENIDRNHSGSLRNYTPPASPVVSGGTVYFDQETQYTNGGGTIMMVDDPGQDRTKAAVLIRKKNGERVRIQLVNGYFRIGSSTERELEYVIRDNVHVSRFHAQIMQRDGAYYLLDMNSSNGTTLNGVPVFSNAEQLLTSGDRIKFANDEFEFILE